MSAFTERPFITSLSTRPPKLGVIVDIRDLGEIGAKGDGQVGFIDVEGHRGTDCLPLSKGHDFIAGENVVITPTIEVYRGGGSVTTYEVTHSSINSPQ